jgi:hypothetical protein
LAAASPAAAAVNAAAKAIAAILVKPFIAFAPVLFVSN